MSYRPSPQPPRPCEQCGVTYTPHDSRQCYCSVACRDERADGVRRSKVETYECAGCGTQITRQRANARYSASGQCVPCSRLRGENHPQWKGGAYLHRGRWWVRSNGGTPKPRARLIMEQHLGRSLETRENVHHINGDPTDDRLENLQVLDVADHARLHHELRQAVAV